MATQIQNVIAQRILLRTKPDGTTSNVEISIGDVTFNPSNDPTIADSWIAWTEVTGVDASDTYRQVVAEDSIQAVYLAMARAGMILSDSDVVSQLEDTGQPNFGFPVLVETPCAGC